jgi:hypothetical protein
MVHVTHMTHTILMHVTGTEVIAASPLAKTRVTTFAESTVGIVTTQMQVIVTSVQRRIWVMDIVTRTGVEKTIIPWDVVGTVAIAATVPALRIHMNVA